ncbi:MAG: IS3 family transposase [Saprospiraceae bacterium]|nr:IS3 family transposase [Saprospiraceae bacterium]
MMPITERKHRLTHIKDDRLSFNAKCELLGICRSSMYYSKREQESDLNLELMNLIDKMYIDHPEYGANRMHIWLCEDKGYQINIKRVERLYYKVMGLKAVLPGPHTSLAVKENKKYPYLLRGLKVTKPNHVWMTDITYISMQKGFMYMAAIIDVYSRKILHWSLSNTMDSMWCCNLLEDCICLNGRPQILNTDQGSQITSDDFVYRVLNNGIQLSMDGKGRATDNIFIERFWSALKYEHIYIRTYSTVDLLYKGIDWHIGWYNEKRRHSELGNNTPSNVYELNKSKNAA